MIRGRERDRTGPAIGKADYQMAFGARCGPPDNGERVAKKRMDRVSDGNVAGELFYQ